MTKSRPSLTGANPKLVADIHPVNPFTAPQWSEKLLNPLVFTGKWRELQSFLSQFRNKLTGNTNYYLTEANWLYYTLNQLGGNTANFIKPLQLNSVQSLVVLLKAIYGDLNHQAIT